MRATHGGAPGTHSGRCRSASSAGAGDQAAPRAVHRRHHAAATQDRGGSSAPEFPKLLAPDIQAHLDTWVASAADAPMFPGPKGGLRRSTIYRAWHKALAEAGLPDDVKPHDLRHLSNTLAAQVPGVTVKDLMARMGHTSEQAALRYLHATAEADGVMAGGLDDAIRRARDAAAEGGDDASNNTPLDGDGPGDTATDVG